MSSKQKTLIVFVFMLVFCACLVYLVFSTPVYQVKASILVQKNDFGIQQIDDFLEFNNPEVSNIVQKLKSVYLLEKTLQKLNYNYPPDSEEFTSIQRNITIRQVPPSNAIQISFAYHSVDEAAQIVNTLVDTLMQEDLKERRAKMKQALESVQTALTLVQAENSQLKPPSPKIDNYSINVYLKEINDDLYKTQRNLVDLQSNLTQNQTDILSETFAPLNLNRFKPTLTVAEKKLARYLLDGGWNNRSVQAQLKYIWKEKTKIAATFKEQLNLRLDIPINVINDICAYEVRRFDLEIRKQELISIKATLSINYGQPPLPSDIDKPYQSLKELEIELVKKQTILQSLNDLTLAKIGWIDKAFPVKPRFRSNMLFTFGLSFGAALFVSFIIGLLCVEYNSYKRNN